MDKLNLRPDAAGYTDKAPNEVISVELDGGASRFRRDKIGARKMVSCTWTLDPLQYQYILAFFNTTTKRGSLAFLCDLVSEDGNGPVEHECNFIPGSFGLSSQKGLTYVVQAQLEVKPLTMDDTFNADLVFLYGLYGDELETLIDMTDHIVNEVMPVAYA